MIPIGRGSLLLAILLAGCGVVAPPQPPAPAKTAEAPVPKAPEAPAAKPPEAPPVAAPAKTPPKPASPAPPAAVAARPASPPPLDLRTLEQRLKDTSAIGVLTKLSLKNQVDDLVQRFRAFHEGQRPPTLTDLRPAYELLLMKVLSLLQDHDSTLANDINASREAIWGVLTDRQKLSQFL